MFIFSALDKENSLDIRLANRGAHVEWLKGLGTKVKLAGPKLDKNNQMIGSVLIIDCETLEEAAAVLAQDPYAKSGLFATTELSAIKIVFNEF